MHTDQQSADYHGRRPRWVWGFVLWCLGGVTATGAAEFRVASSVFLKGQAESIGRNVTYFTDDAAYDLALDGERKGLILDTATSHLTVLDAGQKLVCHVSADELLRTVAAIISRTEDKPAVVRFAAHPKFNSRWDPDRGKLQLVGSPLSYFAATTQPADESIVRSYRQFADWSARLNSTLRGGLPPTARLELNQAICQQGSVPTRVDLKFERQGHVVNYHSSHQFTWQLTDDDHRQIDQLKAWRDNFRQVDLMTLRVDHGLPKNEPRR